MAVIANKRSIMTLYSSGQDPISHQVRIVLFEKGVAAEICEVTHDHKPEHLLKINPAASVPTLVDRDLVVHQPNIIMEYLDERFPHPPLLPVYPVARAKSRMMIQWIQQEWYQELYYPLKKANVLEAKQLRKGLTDSLCSVVPLIADSSYFLGEEFSLIDCCVAPLLWRLPELGIVLPPQAKALKAYAERVFKRSAFKASLTEYERESGSAMVV